MLSPVLVTLSHTAIEKSRKLRMKYPSIVRRAEQNRAIVAIAIILAELVYPMLKNNMELADKIDSLTERKMKSMYQKATNAKASDCLAQLTTLMRGHLLTRSPESIFS